MLGNNQETTSIWQLVTDGQNYNDTIGYYRTVDENTAYIMGDQWRGVVSGGLPTPVFNVIKRVRDYKVASIMSQKIKGQYSLENVATNTQDEAELMLKDLVDRMTNYAEIKWESEKMDSKIRECLMDGFGAGDYAIYTYWDSTKETGQDAKGDFVTEIVDGVNVLFGNPNCHVVEKQPYIIILGRDMVKNLKDEAKRNGVAKQDIESITSDDDTSYTLGQYGKIELNKSNSQSGKCTYAIKLWKENGRVYWTKSTKFCEIRKQVDMRIKRYPIAFGNWEKIKNSYHGRAECTGMLPNQRYINKQFSMIMTWMMYSALGKVAYDSTRIPAWSNQIGVAVPVIGDISGAIQQIPAGNFNSGVLEVVNLAMKETMNALGINDVVMGDIRPENTSAIIAVQKQSAVPLENVQANLYQFVEDIYNIWAEFMVAMYTTDRMLPQREGEETTYAKFNSTPLQDKLLNVKVDVGPSTMWSEVTSIQTLDALLKGNYISMIQYLQRVPDGIIPKKAELLEELRQQMEMQQQAEQQQAMIEQQKGKDEQRMAGYEQVAQEIEQLPPEVQQQFMQLPPEEQEAAVQEYLAQQGGGM